MEFSCNASDLQIEFVKFLVKIKINFYFQEKKWFFVW